MANTTNFGWETPDDTDLVKDGALAMRTLGNAIDASLVDLKGGTTGQILAKNTNTDMDFVWVNNDQGDITAVTAGTGLTGGGTTGAVTVSLDSPVAATLGGTAQTTYTTGDLLYASGTNTLAKRAIGTTGQVLTVSGGVPTWAAPAGGGKVLQVIQTATTSSLSTTSTTYVDVTGVSASITPSATNSKVLVQISLNSYVARTGDIGRARFQILRGATQIMETDWVGWFRNTETQVWSIQFITPFMYLDSPSTTSSTTYKLQVKTEANTHTFKSNTDGGTSTITLMEIGA